MREGVNQGCPLSSTFASLVLNRVLEPLTNLLHKRAQQRLLAGDPSGDGYGSITHLFSWVDDISCTVPLTDLTFLLNTFITLGNQRGCFINPEKSRISPHATVQAYYHYYKLATHNSPTTSNKPSTLTPSKKRTQDTLELN